MKLTRLASIGLLLSVVSLSSIVSAKPVSMYGSTIHPQSSGVTANMLHPPTDITVINASSSYIYAVVPNSPVNDYLSPGFNDHIHNYDPASFSTYLVLQDIYRNTFYAANVCREAIVTVYGYADHLGYNYDDDLCH